MTVQAVQAVVGRALLDRPFRYALYADPELILAEYDLTESELMMLQRIDAETMDSVAVVLESRIIRSPGGAPGTPVLGDVVLEARE